MSPLSALQIQLDRWSKLTLIGATVLFMFSFFTFIGSSEHHGHHGRHHDKKHHSKDAALATNNQMEDQQFFDRHRDQHHMEKHAARARIHHFAGLGLATSVTGVISAFKVTRGWALGFLILVLITEVSALGIIGFESAHAGQKCVARSVGAQMLGDAKPVPGVSSSSSASSGASTANNNNNVVLISAVQRSVQLPNGDVIQEEFVRIDAGGVDSQQQQQQQPQVDPMPAKIDDENNNNKKDHNKKGSHSHSKSKSHSRSHSKMFKKFFAREADPADLRGCLAHVRHVGVLASLIVGVLACSLACCGSRYTNLVMQRDEEEATTILKVETKEAPVEIIENGEVVVMMPIRATSLLPVEEQPKTVVVA